MTSVSHSTADVLSIRRLGIAGLGLVVVGSALLLIENARAERAELQATLLELRDALAASSPATPVTEVVSGDAVVAGASSYHRPTCRLVSGRDDLDLVPTGDAEERGLKACRICAPALA